MECDTSTFRILEQKIKSSYKEFYVMERDKHGELIRPNYNFVHFSFNAYARIFKETKTHIIYYGRLLNDFPKGIIMASVNRKTNCVDSIEDSPCIAVYSCEKEVASKLWAKNGILHRSGNFPAYINQGVERFFNNGYIWKVTLSESEVIKYCLTSEWIYSNLFGFAHKDYREEFYCFFYKHYPDEKSLRTATKAVRKIYLRFRFHAWVRSFLRGYVWNPNTKYGKIWIDQKYNDLNEFQNAV